MDNASQESRRESFLTLRSCRSDNLDVDFDVLDLLDNDGNRTPPPSSPPVKCGFGRSSSRERFGTGITIIAATSPDIKALNLPITPTFPTQLESAQSNSFSGFERGPQPTLNRAQSMKNRVSFLIDTVGEDNEYPEFMSPTPGRMTSKDSFYHDDDDDDDDGEEDYLLRILDPEPVRYHPDENKENIHPNLLQQNSKDKATLTTETQLNEDHFVVKNKKNLHRRRTSFHRRASVESLPSPAEIGPSPGGVGSTTPQSRNLTIDCSSLSFELPELDDPFLPRCQPQAVLPGMRMVSKNMQLSTGFR